MVYESGAHRNVIRFREPPASRISISYLLTGFFHGSNTGSNLVGDAKSLQSLPWICVPLSFERLGASVYVSRLILAVECRNLLNDLHIHSIRVQNRRKRTMQRVR
jgi:hypothetical protein